MQLLDLFFPRWCAICGKLGSYICIKCQQNLPQTTRQLCAYCERESINGLTHNRCARENGVDGLISFFEYSHGIQNIIKQVKYKRNRRIMKDLFKLVTFDIQKGATSLLHPVPLHKNRLKQRGFNQSDLIVAELQARLEQNHEQNRGQEYERKHSKRNEQHQAQHKTPIETNIIKRIIDTPQQARIKDKLQRQKNMKNAFDVNPETVKQYSEITLVDDVWTTGSTIKSIAEALKKAGVKKVFAITLARQNKHRQREQPKQPIQTKANTENQHP